MAANAICCALRVIARVFRLGAETSFCQGQLDYFGSGLLTVWPLLEQEEQRDLAKTIRVSGSILLSTVSNFLDFFKMEAGKHLDIVRTEIDIKVHGLTGMHEFRCLQN